MRINCAGEVFALAIGGQIDDAQVYAQRAAVWLVLLWRFAALRHVQVVDASAPDQISPANFPRRVYQHGVLARAQDAGGRRHDLPGC